VSEALDVLRATLDRAADEGRRVAFWWRDDDAVDVGPRLGRLLSLAEANGAPLALAVVPEPATDRLLHACEEHGVAVLQHGVRHANHQREGRAAELGDARALAEIVASCVAARRRLAGCAVFSPVMVPPWNRMRADLASALAGAGYRGLSLFGRDPADGPPRRVDTHLDPVAWRTDRGLLAPRALAAAMRGALAAQGPVGLLTHHAVHDEATEAFVASFVTLVSRHPAAAWADADELFTPLAEEGSTSECPSPGALRWDDEQRH